MYREKAAAPGDQSKFDTKLAHSCEDSRGMGALTCLGRRPQGFLRRRGIGSGRRQLASVKAPDPCMERIESSRVVPLFTIKDNTCCSILGGDRWRTYRSHSWRLWSRSLPKAGHLHQHRHTYTTRTQAGRSIGSTLRYSRTR